MQSWTVIITTPISDHLPYFILLNCNLSKPTPPSFISITKITPEHIENFKRNIVSADLVNLINSNIWTQTSLIYYIMHLWNPNTSVYLCNVLNLKKHKHKGSRWITLGIIQSISYRNKLYATLKKTNLNDPNYEHMKFNLQSHNKMIKQNIRLTKNNYYKTCFQNHKHNLKITWQTIQCILNKSDTMTKFPEK